MKTPISATICLAAMLLGSHASAQPLDVNVSPTMQLIQQGSVEDLQKAIAEGFDVNQVGEHGATPLLLATANRRLDMMHVLLQHGANVHYDQSMGVTALSIACMYDDWTMIDLLLTYGANADFCASNGETILAVCCSKGAVNAVQMLLTKQPKINTRDHKGVSPLLIAVLNEQENCLDITRMLLEKGADANFAMPDGFSPLMGAVQLNNMQKALLLLEHGANVNARQDNGEGPSALSIAVALGHTDMVSLLLANKADTSVGVNPNSSLLSFTAMLARADYLELLLKNGANAAETDPHSSASLLHLTASGNALIVDSIKLMGANSLLPVHQAKMDAAHACEVLLQYGAQVNAADKNGTTPAMIAAMDGSPDTLKVLIDHGANLNMTDSNGRTPLILAVLSPEEKADISLSQAHPDMVSRIKPLVVDGMTRYPNVKETVRLLLNSGADVTVKDNSGKCARDYVTDAEILQLLNQPEANK